MFCLFSLVTLTCLYNNIQQSRSASINDTETLHKYLISAPKNIKPRVNQSDTLNIDFFLTINSIQNYDEIYGSLDFTGTFSIYWHDEIRTWEPSLFGGINATDLPLKETWAPSLVILNGINHISAFRFDDELHIERSTVTYYYNGRAKILTSGQYQITCLTNVKYYPNDKHNCTISITTAYLLKDVTLTSKFEFHLMSYFPNAEWFITYEKARKSVLEAYISDDIHTRQDKIDIPIFIERRYMYSLVNVIIPILILSLSHCLVFKLPVQSGEKASLAFTLFLMIVVFLTMVVEKLPHSTSISIINAFLLQQLLSSGVTSLLAVYSIRMYYMETTNNCIYIRIKRFYLKCKAFKACGKKWIKTKNNMDQKEEIGLNSHVNKEGDDEAELNDVTDNNFPGKEISIFLDELCFKLFLIVFVLQILIYSLIISLR